MGIADMDAKAAHVDAELHLQQYLRAPQSIPKPKTAALWKMLTH
jgi:hypothetical protein